MKAVTALSTGAATTPGAAPARWGFPEFFVISQTAIPALLYLPGSQQFRLYDPGRWMPPEMSRLMSESVYGLGTVSYRGPDGRMIVRPPGLFDTPGAVAGPGMYAALLGLVFASSAIAWWKRLAALGASFAGI